MLLEEEKRAWVGERRGDLVGRAEVGAVLDKGLEAAHVTPTCRCDVRRPFVLVLPKEKKGKKKKKESILAVRTESCGCMHACTCAVGETRGHACGSAVVTQLLVVGLLWSRSCWRASRARARARASHARVDHLWLPVQFRQDKNMQTDTPSVNALFTSDLPCASRFASRNW
eukprot:194791-Rhodomonas_salina.1